MNKIIGISLILLLLCVVDAKLYIMVTPIGPFDPRITRVFDASSRQKYDEARKYRADMEAKYNIPVLALHMTDTF
jgi:hypothetical protein